MIDDELNKQMYDEKMEKVARGFVILYAEYFNSHNLSVSEMLNILLSSAFGLVLTCDTRNTDPQSAMIVIKKILHERLESMQSNPKFKELLNKISQLKAEEK